MDLREEKPRAKKILGVAVVGIEHKSTQLNSDNREEERKGGPSTLLWYFWMSTILHVNYSAKKVPKKSAPRSTARQTDHPIHARWCFCCYGYFCDNRSANLFATYIALQRMNDFCEGMGQSLGKRRKAICVPCSMAIHHIDNNPSSAFIQKQLGRDPLLSFVVLSIYHSVGQSVRKKNRAQLLFLPSFHLHIQMVPWLASLYSIPS